MLGQGQANSKSQKLSWSATSAFNTLIVYQQEYESEVEELELEPSLQYGRLASHTSGGLI